MARLKSWPALAEDIAAMATAVTGVEELTLSGARGRILAAPVIAGQFLPARTHAVMDGYALGSVPPGRYSLVAGRPERLALSDAVAIHAGDAVPLGAAAVVLAVHADVADGHVTVRESLKKDNIRRAGEEAAPGDVIVPSDVRLDARHLALASAAGVASVQLRRRPRVALLGLHDGDSAFPHLAVLAALLDSPALQLFEAGVMRPATLAEQLKRLAERHDAIIVVAESLGGEEGELATSLGAAGGEPLIRRAAMKPAKPLVTGRINGTAVLGLAGTAYAAMIAAHLFMRPLLAKLAGTAPQAPLIPAVAAFNRSRLPGRAEALPVNAGWRGDSLILTPAGRFGQLKALAAMDGFALIDAEAGDVVSEQAVFYHPLLMPLI